MQKPKSTLARVAEFLYRPPRSGESNESVRSIRVKYFGFVVPICMLLALFAWLLYAETLSWKHEDRVVVLPSSKWKLLPEDVASRCEGLRAESTCAASPSFEALWGSELSRAQRRAGSSAPFWLGLHLTKAQLEVAQAKSAHYLILGWIRGSYQIWVNGEKMKSGDREDNAPVVFSFPLSWLSDSRGLHLAVYIEPAPGVDRPDVFAKPFPEQFTTAKGAQAYVGSVEFYKKSRPFALFIVNLVFAVMFFFVWYTDRQCREAYYLALYTLVSAALQLRLTDIFIGRFTPSVDYGIDLVLRFYEAAFGLFVGLALARTRRMPYLILMPVALVLPWMLLALSPSPIATRSLAFWIERNVLPVSYGLGAMICLMQFLAIRQLGPELAVRRRRLIFFMLGLAGIACIHLLQQHELFNSIWFRMYVWRLSHFGIVMMLALISLGEYREQRRLARRTPLSKYHRRHPLPEKIEGALLVVDLKNSEHLSRASAEMGESGGLMHLCATHLWAAAIKHRGVVLQTDGDQIKAFFEQGECEVPLVSALRAVDEMNACLHALAQQLKDQGVLSDETRSLHFRGGLAWGEIRPTLQEVGSDRLAAWAEAGRSTPFLDAVRMMDMERLVAGDNCASQVLMASSLAEQLKDDSQIEGHFVSREQALEGKHKRAYKVAIYSSADASPAVVQQESA